MRGRSNLAQFDRGQALASLRDARLELLSRLQVDDLRLADRLHVDEDVLALLAFPGPVEDTITLDAVEPFHLHRLIFARGVGQCLAVRALGGRMDRAGRHRQGR